MDTNFSASVKLQLIDEISTKLVEVEKAFGKSFKEIIKDAKKTAKAIEKEFETSFSGMEARIKSPTEAIIAQVKKIESAFASLKKTMDGIGLKNLEATATGVTNAINTANNRRSSGGYRNKVFSKHDFAQRAIFSLHGVAHSQDAQEYLKQVAQEQEKLRLAEAEKRRYLNTQAFKVRTGLPVMQAVMSSILGAYDANTALLTPYTPYMQDLLNKEIQRNITTQTKITKAFKARIGLPVMQGVLGSLLGAYDVNTALLTPYTPYMQGLLSKEKEKELLSKKVSALAGLKATYGSNLHAMLKTSVYDMENNLAYRKDIGDIFSYFKPKVHHGKDELTGRYSAEVHYGKGKFLFDTVTDRLESLDKSISKLERLKTKQAQAEERAWQKQVKAENLANLNAQKILRREELAGFGLQSENQSEVLKRINASIIGESYLTRTGFGNRKDYQAHLGRLYAQRDYDTTMRKDSLPKNKFQAMKAYVAGRLSGKGMTGVGMPRGLDIFVTGYALKHALDLSLQADQGYIDLSKPYQRETVQGYFKDATVNETKADFQGFVEGIATTYGATVPSILEVLTNLAKANIQGKTNLKTTAENVFKNRVALQLKDPTAYTAFFTQAVASLEGTANETALEYLKKQKNSDKYIKKGKITQAGAIEYAGRYGSIINLADEYLGGRASADLILKTLSKDYSYFRDLGFNQSDMVAVIGKTIEQKPNAPRASEAVKQFFQFFDALPNAITKNAGSKPKTRSEIRGNVHKGLMEALALNTMGYDINTVYQDYALDKKGFFKGYLQRYSDFRENPLEMIKKQFGENWTQNKDLQQLAKKHGIKMEGADAKSLSSKLGNALLSTANQTIFNERFDDMKAFLDNGVGLIALMNKLGKEVEKGRDLEKAKSELEKQLATLTTGFDKVKTSFHIMLSAFMELSTPAIKTLIGELTWVAQAVTKLFKAINSNKEAKAIFNFLLLAVAHLPLLLPLINGLTELLPVAIRNIPTTLVLAGVATALVGIGVALDLILNKGKGVDTLLKAFGYSLGELVVTLSKSPILGGAIKEMSFMSKEHRVADKYGDEGVKLFLKTLRGDRSRFFFNPATSSIEEQRKAENYVIKVMEQKKKEKIQMETDLKINLGISGDTLYIKGASVVNTSAEGINLGKTNTSVDGRKSVVHTNNMQTYNMGARALFG